MEPERPTAPSQLLSRHPPAPAVMMPGKHDRQRAQVPAEGTGITNRHEEFSAIMAGGARGKGSTEGDEPQGNLSQEPPDAASG